MTVRWLHISDIHECDRDGHFRTRMYEQIVEKVKGQPAPDIVFLTGDMAFAGMEAEYLSLEDGFIKPLKKVLPAGCPIFTIPGNHDVDRQRVIKPRLWVGDADEAKAFQSIDANGASKRKEMLVPRFAAYAAFDRRVSDWGSKWLESETGAAWWSKEINGTRLGVVGLNTAWLCQDDHDWGNLTPGRYMLEKAIDEARATNPNLLIVLGHHPIEALCSEGELGDMRRIRERLKQANALYLHGHLHLSGNDRVGDAHHNALTIQAPSAFQAHDDERRRNGFLWGEADLTQNSIIIEPLRWNEESREYKFDVDAGYNANRVFGRDAFRLPLLERGAAADSLNSPPKSTLLRIDLPPGWEIIDQAALALVRSQPPLVAEMVAFFDGMLPTWKLALAPGVHRRQIVERLTARFLAAHDGARKPQIVLLTGAGGEGKSTAILHAASVLVDSGQQNWTCLYRQASAAALPTNFLNDLPKIPGNAWVVLIDDADNIGAAILEAAQTIAPRTDIHFLLAAREAEWRLKQLPPGMWQSASQFHTEILAGLDEDDARRIVTGWVWWGRDAMGKLRNSSEDDAVAALLLHARDLATKKDEGELLGALLITRQGDDMRAHVRTMIEGLGREPVVNRFSLRDVYGMIATMHSENQLYLSRRVLAYALGCELGELERVVLAILRREAMIGAGSNYILTRHRRIAEAARLVMQEDGDELDKWFPVLAGAARQEFKVSLQKRPDIEKWSAALAQHFQKKGEDWWTIARAVAKAVYDAEPDDSFNLNHYASILRRTECAREALAILKNTEGRFRDHRDVLHEWATAASVTKDYGLAAWLDGRALADGENDVQKSLSFSLVGLGITFGDLFRTFEDKLFLRARAACGQIGSRLPTSFKTPKHLEYFAKFTEHGRQNGIADLDADQIANAIRRGVIKAADEASPDNDPVFFERMLGDPAGYSYRSMLQLATLSAGPKFSQRKIQRPH